MFGQFERAFSRPLAIFSYGYKCHVGRWVQSFTKGCFSQAPLRPLIRAAFHLIARDVSPFFLLAHLPRLSQPFSVLLRETLSLSLPSLNNEGGRQVARNEGECLLKNLRGPPQTLREICILYFASPRLFASPNNKIFAVLMDSSCTR